jgi:hypothetical protein
MAAEKGNGSVVGWIRQNLVSFLVAGLLWFAGDRFTEMNKALQHATTEISTIAGTLRVHDDRIAGLRERVSRLELGLMPWQRVPQRLPEAPQELPPDSPRHGLVPERSRFN